MNKKMLGDRREFSLSYKNVGFVALFLVCSNILTYRLMAPPPSANHAATAQLLATQTDESLYLLKYAKQYVYDTSPFEKKVRDVSNQLHIAPEWLMAVMHAESRFDASVANKKGGGTAGLIQLSPSAAEKMDITLEQLRNMNHLQQLDYIERYLSGIQQQYRPFDSLTDLYVAILYPDGLNEDYCFSLYQNDESGYHFHSGLDEDKDGRITLQDIDKFLKRIYPTAYRTPKPDAGFIRKILGVNKSNVCKIRYFSS